MLRLSPFIYSQFIDSVYLIVKMAMCPVREVTEMKRLTHSKLNSALQDGE
jgi:hypothetical protein